MIAAVSVAVAASPVRSRSIGDDSSPDQVWATTPRDEKQDLIFLDDERPILLRLHLFVEGIGFRAAWENQFDRLRDFFDKNGDGKLGVDEYDANGFRQMLTTPATFDGSTRFPRRVPQAREIDVSPRDGILSLAELIAIFRPVYTPFLVEQYDSLIRREDALFSRLDRDADGKLAANELGAAVDSIFELDEDGDEMIISAELDPKSTAIAISRRFRSREGIQNSDMFLIVDDQGKNDSTIARMIARYDTGGILKNADAGDGKLERCEIGFDEATFLAADRNRDAKLEAGEIEVWLGYWKPDIELRIELPTESETTRVAILHGNGMPIARNGLSASIDRVKSSDLGSAFDISHSHIEFWPDAYAENLLKQYFIGSIEDYDVDKNGVFERKEIEDFFFKTDFDLLDRDRDGKATLNNFDRLIDVIQGSIGSRCVFKIADKGRSLFDIIDKNRDGRLSVREIRDAKAAILAFDRDGDRLVSFEEITHRFRLKIGRGSAGLFRFDADDFEGYTTTPRIRPMAPIEGAPWFHRMDRNSDGDVSRREFLGTDADFRLIDRDGDGLIDPKEAADAPY